MGQENSTNSKPTRRSPRKRKASEDADLGDQEGQGDEGEYNTNDGIVEMCSMINTLMEDLQLILQRSGDPADDFICSWEDLETKITFVLNHELDLGESSEVSTQLSTFRRMLVPPYLRINTETGFFGAPIWEPPPETQLPFRLGGKNREWRRTELAKLKMCVRRSYFHRHLFFIESKFHMMFEQMGFSLEELFQLQSLQNRMDLRTWQLVRNSYPQLEPAVKARYEALVRKFLADELELFTTFLAKHQEDKKPISPFIIRSGEDHSITIKPTGMIVWRQHEVRTVYMLRYSFCPQMKSSLVDWMMVAKDLSALVGREFSPEECKKTFEFNLSHHYNEAPLGTTELNKLKCLTEGKTGINWADVSTKLGTNRSNIRLFTTYIKFIAPIEPSAFLKDHNSKLEGFYHVNKYMGHIPRIAYNLSEKHEQISLQTFPKEWISMNPNFAQGDFYIAEDALLIIAMQMEKQDLISGGTFCGVQKILPWRYAGAWRYRAKALFRKQSSVWTYSEDELLLRVVYMYGINWAGFSKVLPNKTRRSCVCRFALVRQKLKTVTLAEYHGIYARREPNERSMSARLCEVMELLEEVIKEKLAAEEEESKIETQAAATEALSTGTKPNSENPNFEHLDLKSEPLTEEEMFDHINNADIESDRWEPSALDLQIYSSERYDFSHKYFWRPPGEDACMDYLRTFNVQDLLSTLENLVLLLRKRESSKKIETDVATNVHQSKRLICDRRKFDIRDPISLASALHLRDIELKPMTHELWESLSSYEKLLFMAHRIFSGNGWKTKKGTFRSGVPSQLELLLIPTIHRLITFPEGVFGPPSSANDNTDSSGVLTNENNDIQLTYPTAKGDTQINLTPTVMAAYTKLTNRLAKSLKPTVKAKRAPIRRVTRKKNNKAAAKIRWENHRKNACTESTPIMAIEDSSAPPGEMEGPSIVKVVHDHGYYKHCSAEFELINTATPEITTVDDNCRIPTPLNSPESVPVSIEIEHGFEVPPPAPSEINTLIETEAGASSIESPIADPM